MATPSFFINLKVGRNTYKKRNNKITVASYHHPTNGDEALYFSNMVNVTVERNYLI